MAKATCPFLFQQNLSPLKHRIKLFTVVESSKLQDNNALLATSSSIAIDLKEKEMLRKLWRGDLPLWFTFWILGVIIFGSLRFLFYFINQDPLSLIAQYGIYPITLLDAFSLIYGFIIWVAIWRSADNYKGSQFLVAGAKLVVILSALSMFWLRY